MSTSCAFGGFRVPSFIVCQPHTCKRSRAESAAIFCSQLCCLASVGLSWVMVGALAAKWESLRRVRNRFHKGQDWVKFPPIPDDNQKEGTEPNSVSTVAVGLNAPALYLMAEHYGVYGGKKIPVKKVEKEVH